MKRHPSLIPLSRFHRSVLFLALVCKKNAPPVQGYPTDDDGKRDYALGFYQRQLWAHINREEKRLFPAITGKTEEIDSLVAELQAEHKQLNKLFNDLSNTTDLSDSLNELGVLLETHVRKEERKLFQAIQEAFTEEELLQLGTELDA